MRQIKDHLAWMRLFGHSLIWSRGAGSWPAKFYLDPKLIKGYSFWERSARFGDTKVSKNRYLGIAFDKIFRDKETGEFGIMTNKVVWVFKKYGKRSKNESVQSLS